MLIGLDNQDSTSSDRDSSNDIRVIEQIVSELEVRYRQKRGRQQKALLVIKGMLHKDSETPSFTVGKPDMPYQYCGSGEEIPKASTVLLSSAKNLPFVKE